jgi:hypothetical protein
LAVNIPEWQSGVDYLVGDMFVSGGQLYVVTADHTSTVNPAADAASLEPVGTQAAVEDLHYGFGIKTADQAVSVASDVTWDTSEGSVPFDGTSWTLSAGNTYYLEAQCAVGDATAQSIQFAWVDSSDAQLSGVVAGNSKSPTGVANGSSQSESAGYITPVADMTVKVRVTDLSGATEVKGSSSSASNGSSYARVQQIPAKTVINSNDVAVYGSYADDAAAATGSVPVGGVYLNTTTGFAHTRMV